MQAITTIGLDITKSAFQVHGVGRNGKVVVPAVRRGARVTDRCPARIDQAWWGSNSSRAAATPSGVLGRLATS
jgi:hypothetical protein